VLHVFVHVRPALYCLLQVEAEASPVSSGFPDLRLLVNKDLIVGLNSIVTQKGEAKLELLRAIKDFKRGIYALQWENKRCEMEAEDVGALTKELQLLHVTKDFQQQLKTGGVAGGSGAEGKVGGKEVANLEALYKVRYPRSHFIVICTTLHY
jgi:hypothetical protein